MSAAETGGAARPRWRAASSVFVSTGGLLGLLGVAVSAASTHVGGGMLGQTAGTFLLLHAAVVLALAALIRSLTRPAVLVVAASVLTLGVIVFSGDLALAGFLDWRPFPPAAPIGGGLMVIGWLTVVIGGLSMREPA